MLRQLRIGNFALVEDLTLELDVGLTMLTGETGAGKSLVAGALSLLTGVKADRDLIRAGEDLAWVEGVFDLGAEPETVAWLGSLGVRLGGDDVLVLRRELRREGRSRVLVDGLVSSLALLAQIGGRLLAVQSQDQQRQLSRPEFARDFLDAALGLRAERERVAAARSAWRARRDELARRRQEEEFARQQLEMWEYQHRELTELGLDAAEEAALAEQLAFGRNARGLLEAAGRGLEDLSDGEVSARQRLGSAESALAGAAETSERLAAVRDLIREAEAAVTEAARLLERFLDGAEVDPARLDEIEERKARYEELRRKYDRDVPGLMALRDALSERIGRQREAASAISALNDAESQARQGLVAAVLTLREQRMAGAAGLAARATEVIRPLALPDLEVAFTIVPRIAAEDGLEVDGIQCRVADHGADDVQLRVRTNRGEPAGDVAAIASGGERSRIYLGLTVLGAAEGPQPLLLFDEIDAGLGMDNAIPVAELLARLADRGQVVCITHLATVAARGVAHLKVAKEVVGERTILGVTALDEAGRLAEIARLLGGEQVAADAARDERLAYAKQLLARS